MKSKFLAISAAVAITAMASCGAQQTAEQFRNPQARLSSKIDSVSYALGVNIGTDFLKNMPEIDKTAFLNGMMSAMNGDTTFIFPQETAPMLIRGYIQERAQKEAKENLAEAKKFLEENKKKDGVITIDSLGGLQYQVIKEGIGPHPTIDDEVECYYTGTLTDGTVFDSTDKHPDQKPAKFTLKQVIKGWQYGIPLMSVGSKYRFFVPPAIGYGEQVRPGGVIKANNVLIFDVELLSITPKEDKK